MREIDYLAFKKLLHIDDDDHWLGGDSPFLYRIAGGAVRAVPFGFKVDQGSLAPVRPLVRVSNYNPACFESLSGEADELEMYNPSGAADAVLFQFPATVEVVSDFLNRADLWWMVDKVLWGEYRLDDAVDACRVMGNADGNPSPAEAVHDHSAAHGDESRSHIYKEDTERDPRPVSGVEKVLLQEHGLSESLTTRHESDGVEQDVTDVVPENRNASDASLGALYRKNLSAFGKVRGKEIHDQRSQMWACWKQEAIRIQEARRKPASKRSLACMVKKNLQLNDSVETIRRRI